MVFFFFYKLLYENKNTDYSRLVFLKTKIILTTTPAGQNPNENELLD